MATYTSLQHGIGPLQIAEAFDDTGDHRDRALIEFSCRFIGQQLLAGRFTSYARAFGGGEPIRLGADVWELDDFTPRFATCAIDPRRPFDLAAPATHRIFVSEDDVQAIFDACCADMPAPTQKLPRRIPASPQSEALAALPPRDGDGLPLDRMIKMAELERLVGMTKSTIYDRIAKGRFPAQVKNGERISNWRESDVRAWLADPQ